MSEALDAAVVAHLVRPVVGQAGHTRPRLLRRRPGHPEDLKLGKKSLVMDWLGENWIIQGDHSGRRKPPDDLVPTVQAAGGQPLQLLTTKAG